MNFYCIADEDTVRGLRLAGVSGRAVATAQEAGAALAAAIADAENGVIILTQDVAVDIRKGSPTFGKHVAVELTDENKRQLFVPRGFAHGFVVLSEIAVFQYKCDNLYAPQEEGAIAWNDPAIGIDWKIDPSVVLLSEKDKKHPFLADSDYLFDFNENLYE